MGNHALGSEKRTTVHMMNPDDLTIVGLDTKDKNHPLYDERAFLPLDESMIASIMAIGVKENVHVTIEKHGDKKLALVVDGRRRVLHAREANKRLAKLGEPLVSVPTTIAKTDEAGILETMIALNEIRLEDPVLTKAEKAARMLDRVGDKKTVCRAFGITLTALNQWLALATLSKPVKDAIRAGKIAPTSALPLVDLPADQQKAKLAELIQQARDSGAKKVTGRVVSRAMRGDRGERKAPSKMFIRRVLEHDDLIGDRSFELALRWVLGFDVEHPGLEAAVVEARKPKKRGRRKKVVEATPDHEEDESEVCDDGDE